MRTSNPALTANTFKNVSAASSEVMTINGVIGKCFVMIALVFTTAIWSWQQVLKDFGSFGIPAWYWGALLGGFVVALTLVFKKEWSPFLAPVYAALEGLTLGFISAVTEQDYPGIVLQAMLGTISVFVALLLAYKSGLIKASENFKLGVVAATGGIALVYVIDLVLMAFGTQVPFIHQTGWLGIGFSLFVVVIAALNLVLDFDFIEQGAENRAPKYMEWYAAFGLVVTLVWLYLEILRLLSKSRKD